MEVVKNSPKLKLASSFDGIYLVPSVNYMFFCKSHYNGLSVVLGAQMEERTSCAIDHAVNNRNSNFF